MIDSLDIHFQLIKRQKIIQSNSNSNMYLSNHFPFLGFFIYIHCYITVSLIYPRLMNLEVIFLEDNGQIFRGVCFIR